MSARFRLRDADKNTYLERWGWECKWFGIFIHHIQGADPGRDLHDHPWWFGSFILKGGYYEKRALIRDPQNFTFVHRRRWSWKSLPRTVCHTIWRATDTWTLVIHGPRRGHWGFYPKSGWVIWHQYPDTADADRGIVN